MASDPTYQEQGELTTPAHRKLAKGRRDTPYHFDAGKSRVDVIPPSVIESVGDIFAYGADKYGERNWEQHADSWEWCQLYASAMRHMLAWARGEDKDPESGLSHLDHAICNLMMLQGLAHSARGKDDRTKLRPIQRHSTKREAFDAAHRASEGKGS